MTPDRTTSFTLEELVERAADLVARIGVAVPDARVSEAPDGRAIRYYQSLGLVDRPAAYDGRRALYGWRSLIQAVAVKLLQSQGRSLAQIQAAFSARPFEQLEAAVLEALGEAPARAQLPPEPAPVALRTWQIAPGVVLSVDPNVVADPEGLARRVHLAITRGGPS